MSIESGAVRVLIAAFAGVLVGVAVPLGNVWLKCRQPTSEACVWAKAYLPLSLGLTLVIVGIPVFVVTLLLLRHYTTTRLP